MKRINTYMALQWIIYLPIILCLSIFFGAFYGIFICLKKVFMQFSRDIQLNYYA